MSSVEFPPAYGKEPVFLYEFTFGLFASSGPNRGFTLLGFSLKLLGWNLYKILFSSLGGFGIEY